MNTDEFNETRERFSPPSYGRGGAEGDGVVESGSKNGGWVVVCKLDDIVPNTGVGALVDGRQVAIFRLDDDSVYAIGNHDPFSRANVLSRGIVGDLRGEVVVASPVYKQHFSLTTGRCLEDTDVRVPTFEVRLEAGAIYVKSEGGRRETES